MRSPLATARYIVEHVYPLAAGLLPAQMDSAQSRAMLTAIALQESRFQHRRQMGNGPARGWWQFEMGGVEGVLSHHASRSSARELCALLGYDPDDERGVHLAIEHNDVLACAFARLLLWTDARMLPTADKSAAGWLIYLGTWRPGKPHPQTWAGHFERAWSTDWPGVVKA